MRRASAIALASLLGLTACRTAMQTPDLGTLYDQAAQHHHHNRNPVVVIPGLLGSRLVDPETGRVAWGAFGGNASNPRKPDGALLLGLPMDPGSEMRELRDEVRPDGVLDRFQLKLMGLPFQLKAYFQILLTLGAGGYRDESIHEIDWGSEHFTCFQFDYDWRRDNIENARRLHDFLREKRDYVVQKRGELYGKQDSEVKFDLVAHSMGGLLVRYLLRYGSADLPEDGSLPELTWAGAELVERAILIGPPNTGSLDALRVLVEGRKYGPLIPRYEPALLGTFPALYQLLPRPRHGALVDAADRARKLDFMDPELWKEMGWGLMSPDQEWMLEHLLPEVAKAGERRRIAFEHLRKSLSRTQRFHAALDRKARRPEGLDLYLLAGDAVDTDHAAAVAAGSGRLDVFQKAPGDGTVLRTSALADERVGHPWTPGLRSPIDWSHVSFLFSDHLGMTKDPAFADNVLYLLLESPREVHLADAPTTR